MSTYHQVRAIIRVIVTGAIKEKPKNIFTFAADIFSARNYKEIGKQVKKTIYNNLLCFIPVSVSTDKQTNEMAQLPG